MIAKKTHPEDDGFKLLSRASSGEPGTMSKVVEQFGPRLHQLIRLRMGPSLRNRLESRDVLQATLLRAFVHLDQYQGTQSGALMAWLGTIAGNEIRAQANFHGRQKRDAGRTVPLSEGDPILDRLVRSEVSRLGFEHRLERLESELEKLTEDHREVIVLRRLEELSFPQIAERLGRSGEACRKLFARAMTQLTLQMREAE